MLAVTWTWWGWKQGAFFGRVLLPGTAFLCLATVLLTRTAPWRGRISLSPRGRLALLALVGLGLWTLVSMIWSPAPDIALGDAQRVLAYALSFGLGIWLCNLVGPRMHLALAPLAIAGGLVAAGTTLALLTGHDIATYLETDGTLQYPLGYRNANAAFFLIAVWPLLGICCTGSLRWGLRGVAAGAGSMCLSLAMLSQSRGSVIAAAAAVAVFLTLSPRRATALGWLGIIALPSVLVVPYLSELYSAAGDHNELLTPLHHAAAATIAAAAIAALVGAAFARLEAGMSLPADAGRRIDRLVGRGLVVAAVIGALGFVVAVGNPVSWFSQRVSEFSSDQSPDASQQATHFGFNAGTARGDLWRVAVDDAVGDPVLGDGAGGYRYSYLLHRHSSDQSAHDAHSVELETLSELGIPGLALLVLAMFGAGAGALRAGRLGPSAATLAAVALAAGAYWMVHASIDWFWPYPAVTAPVLCLLGAACAPAMRTPSRVPRGSGRRNLGILTAILALSVVPPYLSQRYVDRAYSEWRTDLGRAFSDLGQAGSLNPLSIDPQMGEGVISRYAGQHDRAIAAFTVAADRRPEEWAAHYFLARLYAQSNPALAARELHEALALNPREPVLRSFERDLQSRTAKTHLSGKSGSGQERKPKASN